MSRMPTPGVGSDARQARERGSDAILREAVVPGLSAGDRPDRSLGFPTPTRRNGDRWSATEVPVAEERKARSGKCTDDRSPPASAVNVGAAPLR